MESDIQGRRFVRLAMALYCARFPGIMVAVVEKENDLAANLLLQAPRRENFCDEKAFRKESARLLSETDDRGVQIRDVKVKSIVPLGRNRFCAVDQTLRVWLISNVAPRPPSSYPLAISRRLFLLACSCGDTVGN